MKINRHKKVNKYLSFYCNNYGFRKPYQVLIDGTFCHASLKNKLNIQEQLPKYLGEVKLLTTPCVIVEAELLGKTAFGAMVIVKQFSVHHCKHINKPVSGSQCFQSMLGDSNSSRYMVATQDRDLQDVVRNIAGTPLIYLHQKTPHLEEPSPLSLKVAAERNNQIFGISKLDDVKLATLKTEAFGKETEIKAKKRKRRGGPNPLSCKKKKNKGPELINQNVEQSQNKTRRRKRIKLSKHIKEHLINNI